VRIRFSEETNTLAWWAYFTHPALHYPSFLAKKGVHRSVFYWQKEPVNSDCTAAGRIERWLNARKRRNNAVIAIE
jgi:hypothetical protein